MSDVFVSYSHVDRTFVRRLHEALTGLGKQVWVDDHGIPPASRWADYLKEAIETADSFVFVISPDSASSIECRKELDHAASLGKRIIPVNFRAFSFDQLPAVLVDRQFVPGRGVFEDDFETSLHLLVAAIETDLDWVQEHTRWGTKAIEWDEHDRGRSLLVGGSELRAAETWLARGPGKQPEPTALQNAFVLASRRASDRRQRSLLGGVSAALVVSLALGGLALFQWNQAVSNQEIAESRQEAAESESALSSDPELSTLLALQALRIRPTAQAVTALRDALPQLQVRRTLTGAAPMQSAVFSPNGAEVATADLDGDATIWSASTGKRLRVLHTPRGVSISTVAFGSTGTELVTAGVDGTARIWSTATGQQRVVLGEPGGTPLNDAVFSPNGAEVVVADLDNNVTIWSASTGRVIETLRVPGQDGVNTVMFSRNGSEVVTAAGNAARTWSVQSAKQLMVFAEPGGASVNGAAFSPSGTLIVTASGDGTARIWNAVSGQQRQVLGGLEDPVLNGAAFSPNSREVVTASAGGTATTWDAASGKSILVLSGHRGPVSAASFSPSGSEVVTASDDGTAKIWDARPVGTRRVFTDPTRAALGCGGFNRSGTEVVAAVAKGSGVADIWDVVTGRLVHRLEDSTGATFPDAIDFSPNGKELVTASETDGTATVWSAVTGRQLLVLRSPGRASLYTAMFSPGGAEIVTSSDDDTARIWSAATGSQVRVITEPEGKVTEPVILSAAFNRSGSELVTASIDGTARIWSAATGKELQVMAEPRQATVITAAFSPNGSEVLTSSVDGTARIWSAATGKQLEVMTEPGGAQLYSAAFSPDGSEVVTSSADGSARIWSAATGEQLTVFETGSGVNDSQFSPNGTEVMSTTESGNAIVWSTELAGTVSTLERVAHSLVERQLTAAERRAYL